MIFHSPIKIDILNFKTSENWQMLSVDSAFSATNTDFERIKNICNEPLVYEWLFKENLNNKPYSIEKAIGFVEWAQKGWREQKYFVFLIKDSLAEIQAAVDIKSNNLDVAEVGYWASADKPGIVTNVVKKLCELAKQTGYKSLFSDVQVENHRSKNVLTRASFSLEKKFSENNKDYYRYSKKLK